MGTLASELAGHADSGTDEPRVYVDANVSATLVTYMRQRLHWDVLHVVEEDDLRRASDVEHFRLARQLRRTLLTLDRDFLDDRRFPPAESGGVILLSAPDDDRYRGMLQRIDAELLRGDAAEAGGRPAVPTPLAGQKRHLQAEWLQPQRTSRR